MIRPTKPLALRLLATLEALFGNDVPAQRSFVFATAQCLVSILNTATQFPADMISSDDLHDTVDFFWANRSEVQQ